MQIWAWTLISLTKEETPTTPEIEKTKIKSEETMKKWEREEQSLSF